MRRKKGDRSPNDWGAHEIHDWGVPPPQSSSSPAVPSGIASVSDASGGAVGISPLLFTPEESTPPGHDGVDPEIPAVARWAMEDRRHSSRNVDPDDTIECRLGTGDATVYVIDDGPDHCMISRLVGEDEDGCVYCLVARIASDRFAELRDGAAALEDAFAGAHDIALSSVFESPDVSNVVLVEHYPRVRDVPPEYLPPSPFIPFT